MFELVVQVAVAIRDIKKWKRMKMRYRRFDFTNDSSDSLIQCTNIGVMNTNTNSISTQWMRAVMRHWSNLSIQTQRSETCPLLSVSEHQHFFFTEHTNLKHSEEFEFRREMTTYLHDHRPLRSLEKLEVSKLSYDRKGRWDIWKVWSQMALQSSILNWVPVILVMHQLWTV